MPDRNLAPRPRREQGPHLAQVVIDNRLAAVEALLRDQLADALAGQLWVLAQQLADLVLEHIELRACRRALVPRWPIAVDRVADRVAMQPRPAMDLPLRQTAHEVQPPHLRPLLHSDHLGPPELALRKTCPGNPDHRTSSGPLFNRRRWPSFHPAPTQGGLTPPPEGRRRRANKPPSLAQHRLCEDRLHQSSFSVRDARLSRNWGCRPARLRPCRDGAQLRCV